MTKYYFFKTVRDSKGNLRFNPLSNQMMEDGSTIDTSFHIQGDKTIRLGHGVGSIFTSDKFVLSSGGNYYSVGTVKVVWDNERSWKDTLDKASYEALSQFIDYCIENELSIPDYGIDELRADTDKCPSKPKKTSKVTLLSEIVNDPDLSVPVESDGFYVNQLNWTLMIRNIKKKINTLLIGPTGSGKTELVMLVCKKLGIPCHIYDMGSMYDPISGMLGVHRLMEGGVSKFDYAKFTKDIAEPGVVLLDELSRAPVTTNNILFPCLDSRRELPVEIAGGTDIRNVKVHPECCFIATANIGSEYTGTQTLDKALLNRFFPIELDYLSETSEANILIARTHISKSDANNIAKVAKSIREKYYAQTLSSPISTRETLMAAEMIADGYECTKAMQLVFLPLFEGSLTTGSERSIVNKTIAAR